MSAEAHVDNRSDVWRLAHVPVGTGIELSLMSTALTAQVLIFFAPGAQDASTGVRLLTLLVACTALVAALTAGAMGLRRQQQRPAGVQLDARTLSIFGPDDRKVVEIPHERIFSLELVGGRWARVVMGVRGRPSIQFPVSIFESPEHAAAFVDTARARVAALPGVTAAVLAARARVSERVFRGIPWLTCAVVLPLIAITLLQLALGATDAASLFELGAVSGDYIAADETLRLFSGPLLHTGLGHVAANAAGLLVIGAVLERVLGGVRFGLILGLASLAGCTAVAWMRPGMLCVGASGALMGGLGAWFGLLAFRREELPSQLRLPPIMGATLLGSLVVWEFLVAGLAHEVHAMGLLTGFVLTPLLCHGQVLEDLHRHTPRWQKLAAAALGLAYLIGAFHILAAAWAR